MQKQEKQFNFSGMKEYTIPAAQHNFIAGIKYITHVYDQINRVSRDFPLNPVNQKL